MLNNCAYYTLNSVTGLNVSVKNNKKILNRPFSFRKGFRYFDTRLSILLVLAESKVRCIYRSGSSIQSVYRNFYIGRPNYYALHLPRPTFEFSSRRAAFLTDPIISKRYVMFRLLLFNFFKIEMK
jgi:hypothetical protein